MNVFEIQESLNLALKHHQEGAFSEAEILYEQVLKKQPDNTKALHLLGVIAYQNSNHDRALELIGKACALDSSAAEFYCNYGLVWEAKGKLHEAITCYQRAIQILPSFSAAHYNLGNAFAIQDRIEEAITSYKESIRFNPAFLKAYNNLGNLLTKKGNFLEAKGSYQKALQLDPSYAEANHNFAILFYNQKQFSDAIIYFQKAIQLQPNYFQAYHGLGNALKEQNKLSEAIDNFKKAVEWEPSYYEAILSLANAYQDDSQISRAIEFYQKALALKSGDPIVYSNLGRIYYELSDLGQAVFYFQKAIETNPHDPTSHNNLGSALKNQGKVPEAIACYRKAIEIKPHDRDMHSNLLFTLNHDPHFSSEKVFKEHLYWAKQHEKPLVQNSIVHLHHRDPDRKLKIGYLSTDFYRHVNACVIEPFLKNHNRERFEIFCYSNVTKPDEVTEHLRRLTNHWRDIKSISDQDVAELIRKDQIDVLVELSGHTGANRLLVMAYQPAPVQVNYLGYVNTTGMKTIDYRLTDIYGDPPEITPTFYSEKSVYLPETLFCFEPRKQSPNINPLPALSSGRVTFGSANNLAKITPEVIELWSNILHSMPHSILIMKAKPLAYQDMREKLLGKFLKHGIKAEQLELRGWVSSSHLEFFNEIDIHLDPFPFTGGMTSFESLWMGVPVITLAGNHFASRLTLRYLAILGLDSWIAKTPNEYVNIATQIASNLDKLNSIRLELRKKILHSPLTDGPRFTRNLENAYRKIWRQWCKDLTPEF